MDRHHISVAAGDKVCVEISPYDLTDPPPLKWSDLRYVFDSQEGHDGKEALQG